MKIRFILNVAIALVLIAATAQYGGKRPGIVETLEKQNYDWRLLSQDPRKNDDIVIIDIDRDSLRKYGNWPWPRDTLAALTDQLFKKYKVRILAYALPFSERGDTAIRVLDDIKKQLDLDPTTNRDNFNKINALRDELDYDRRLANAMRDREIVLGHRFIETGRIQAALPPPVRLKKGAADLPAPMLNAVSRKWPLMRGYNGNRPILLRAVKNAAGHLNVNADDDGVVRSAPFVVKHAGAYYESLPLAVALRLQKLYENREIAADIESQWSPFSAAHEISSLAAGRYAAKASTGGNLGINFLGRGGRNVDFEGTANATFRYVSFIDVIEGRVKESFLEDKIALVGSSSPQLRDVYPTPVNSAMPGVELLATQLANLIDGDALHRSVSVQLYEMLILLLVALVLSALFVYLGPLLSFPVFLLVAGGYIFFVLNQWETSQAVWSMTPMLLVVSGLFIFNAIAGFVSEWNSSRRLQNTFGQYVPPEFAKRLGKTGEKINLEGEERELSVLFSDVRNFTAVSENLSPRDLTLLMNRMLTRLSESIHQNDGTVDKYIGDAVMAFWNAPLHDDKHAKKSVLAAIAMQAAMKEVSDQLVAGGFQEMRLGVGICTGNANVGNMGSTLRMTYTAIGYTVNLASRTEGLTKYYGCPILVTETTRAQCDDGDIVFRTVDMVRVKGRNQPVTLYEPYGLTKSVPLEMTDHLKVFEAMLREYFAGQFAESMRLLQQYQAAVPDDSLAAMYAKRLDSLQKSPPNEWDGVISYDVK